MGPEWIFVAVVILVLFGGSKLPALFRSLGRAKTEFEAGTRETPSPAPTAADEKP